MNISSSNLSPIRSLPNANNIIEIPQELWRAGPAARAPLLGSRAVPIEGLANAARRAAKSSPGRLRGLIRGAGPNIVAGLAFGAAEWAAEWLLENVIEPYQRWDEAPAPGTGSLGWRISLEYARRMDGQRFVQRLEVPPNSPGVDVRRMASGVQYGEQEPSPGNRSWFLFFNAVNSAGIVEPITISSVFGSSTWEFIRIIDFVVLGLPTPSLPALSDPYILPRGNPGEGWPPIPLSLPFPGPGGVPIEIPGTLTPRTPFTEGIPRPGYDFDWLPDDRPGLAPMPGVRLGFRPGGAVIQEFARDLLLDLAETVTDQILEEVLEGGNCPDPCPEIDYEKIRLIAAEELDSKFPPRRPLRERTVTYLNRNSLSVDLPSFSRFVEVEQTQIPANARRQWGGSDAPEVIFSGWASFGFGTNGGFRERIDYESCSFPVPPEANSLIITLYEGHRATIRITYLSEEET